MEPTDEQRRQVALNLEDPKYFIESAFFIVDHNSHKVPYLLNPLQRDYYKKRTGRDIIVKARKMGFSALITAMFLHACIFTPNTRAVVISHDEDAAKKLFRRVQYYRDTSLYPIRVNKASEHEYSFPDTDSWFYIGTAGSRAFGRGDDITHLHLSERAHYRDESVMTSAPEAMVKSGGWIVQETTANGAGTPFHASWLRAIGQQSEWVPHFYGWWQDPLNQITSTPLVLDEEEQRLHKAFNLSYDQIAWRRNKLRTMEDPTLFHQEHPSTWEEAFLASGRMVFDWEGLKRQEEAFEQVKWRGHLMDRGSSLEVQNDPKGPFTVWRSPVQGRRYLVIADAADGVPGGAYSVADVYDMHNWAQVAQFRGHISPIDFGVMLARIGAFYGWALVGPENNTPGNAVLVKLIDLGYPNIYDEPNETGDRLGWMTTERSKAEYVSDGRACIKDGSIKLNSKDTLNELRTFCLDERGKMGPQSGCWQDTVVVCCKAANVLKRFHYDDTDTRKRSFREVMGIRRGGGASGGDYKRGVV